MVNPRDPDLCIANNPWEQHERLSRKQTRAVAKRCFRFRRQGRLRVLLVEDERRQSGEQRCAGWIACAALYRGRRLAPRPALRYRRVVDECRRHRSHPGSKRQAPVWWCAARGTRRAATTSRCGYGAGPAPESRRAASGPSLANQPEAAYMNSWQPLQSKVTPEERRRAWSTSTSTARS